MVSVLRIVLGILLVPVVIGYGMAFYEVLLNFRQIRTPELNLLLGVTSYLAFHVLVGVPTRIYVLGHELMHAAAAWISGGKVKAFKVGKTKGSVTTDRVTAFIALAPYAVPLYAVLWTLGYGLAQLFWKDLGWSSTFFFVLGVTLTFHLVFTVEVLKQRQTDLEITGPLLGLGLIVWFNLALIVAALNLVVDGVRFLPYLGNGFHHTRAIFQGMLQQLF